MRTVTCTCIECGKHFESTFTLSNCCDDCWEVSVIFIDKESGEEWYVNVPKRDSEAKKAELIAEGRWRVYITNLIQTAF
ncbi:MAG: hypothetical protein K0R18_254 [Bacillales bacterium]|jgi:hypothetical protein|nr:hypothetical protein [Bacillales bacterium]